MTKWEAGDDFELICRGRVAATGSGLDQSKICIHLWSDEHSTIDYGRAVYAPESWFDEHATKIERPLEFGQMVMVEGSSLLHRVLEHADGLVRVWPIGLAHTVDIPRSDVTVVED